MATNARTLEIEAFTREVTEKHLEVSGPYAGYLYAGYQGMNGWEVIRAANNPWYFWVYRQVCTQDNAGGGNLTVTVTTGTDQICKLCAASITASGNRALAGQLQTPAGNVIGRTLAVSAVAGAIASIPSIGTASTGSANTMQTKDLTFGAGSILMFQVTAAAQTETATLVVTLLSNTPTRPTVAWAGGTPNVAAASIDTLTLVPMI